MSMTNDTTTNKLWDKLNDELGHCDAVATGLEFTNVGDMEDHCIGSLNDLGRVIGDYVE